MRLAAPLVAIALLPLEAGAVLAPSNLDLVTVTARQAVTSALGGIELGAAGPGAVTVHAAARHPANWLVEHLLAEALLERGLDVAVADAGEGPRLDYRIVDLSVTGRPSLLGGSVDRRCRVVVRLDLVSHGEQVSSGEGHIEESDTIPMNQLDALQHARFAFAKTDIEKRSLGKYMEPVIITTVLGSLVYLFFSNR